MVDLIDSSYANLDAGNLLPSFLHGYSRVSLNFQNGSLWGIGLIMCVALVSFMTFKAYSTDRAMIVSAIYNLDNWVLGIKGRVD